MNLSTYLGPAGLTGVGYQFFNDDETANGPRLAANVIDAGKGWYSIITDIPAGATSVRWDSTADTSAFAREYFYELIHPTEIVEATISLGTGTGQLDLDNGRVKVSQGTGVGQLDLVNGNVKVAVGTEPGYIDLTSGQVKIMPDGITVSSFQDGSIRTAAFAPSAINNTVLAAETGLVPARYGQAQAGGTNYVTLDPGASATSDMYRNGIVLITGGRSQGSFGIIESYNGLTKVATVTTPFYLPPDETSTFAVLPLGGIATSAPSAEDIADAVSSRVIASMAPSAQSSSGAALTSNEFDFTPAGLNLFGVVGNDLSMDVYFHNMDLTGYDFTGYVILEPSPLEKRYPLTVTPIELTSGQINVSLTEVQTKEIGPVSGKPWYIRWDGGATAIVRNLLMGKLQLNRF